MSSLKQKLKKANEALTFVNHIEKHLEPKTCACVEVSIFTPKVMCKICDTTIDKISDGENKSPVTELIIEWLQQKLKENNIKIKDYKNKFPTVEPTDPTPLDLELLLTEQETYLKLLEDLEK